MQVELQIALLWAGVNGFLDDIATNDITQFETEYLEYLQTSERKLLKSIKEEKKLSEDIEKKLKKAVEDFKKSWQVKK